MAVTGARFLAGLALTCALSAPALADKIKNPTAVFAGLDKITGRIIAFEVAIGETVQFGALQLTPRVCYSRPPYENPQTTSFVEVDEIGLSNEYKRLFTGWMFAASPGLNAIEHAVYDIWLTECKGGSEIIKVAPEKEETPQAVQPVEVRRPPRPPQAPSPSRQRQDIDARPQPSQRFFPTDTPPAPAPSGNVGRPMQLPVGPDPAGGTR